MLLSGDMEASLYVELFPLPVEPTALFLPVDKVFSKFSRFPPSTPSLLEVYDKPALLVKLEPAFGPCNDGLPCTYFLSLIIMPPPGQ